MDPSQIKDGPAEDCESFIYAGKRHSCSRGQIFETIKLMWTRERASYAEVFHAIDDYDLSPDRMKDICSKSSAALEAAGVPWRLSNNSRSDCIVKKPRKDT